MSDAIDARAVAETLATRAVTARCSHLDLVDLLEPILAAALSAAEARGRAEGLKEARAIFSRRSAWSDAIDAIDARIAALTSKERTP